jgi:hypothetical protein
VFSPLLPIAPEYSALHSQKLLLSSTVSQQLLLHPTFSFQPQQPQHELFSQPAGRYVHFVSESENKWSKESFKI